MLSTHGRYDYSPISERCPYEWPGGRRLAVYIGLNVEAFAFGEGLGAELAPGGPQPDILNYAWRDYGNRVGVWRMLDLLDALRIPTSALLNSAIYNVCPQIPAAFLARGDEIVAHGRTNAERQSAMPEAEEARLIAATTETITRHDGRAPAGWLSPWIAESLTTPDLLAEAGYRYTLNWCQDDQPIWMATRSGRKLLSVPYPEELNDIPAIVVRRTSMPDFADMIVDQFEEMRAQSLAQPLVMSIALHPYIVGQPYRLRHLRRALAHIAAAREAVWICTAGAIAEHTASLPSGIVPGS